MQDRGRWRDALEYAVAALVGIVVSFIIPFAVYGIVVYVIGGR